MSSPNLPLDGEAPEVTGAGGTAPSRDAEVVGERGIPSVNRLRSMQSRVTNVLAVGFLSLMTLGFLAWYYVHSWQKTNEERDQALAATQQRAQGEMKLPPLPRLQAPRPKAPEDDHAPEDIRGSPPPAPPAGRSVPTAYRPQSASTRPASPDRRLTGPVLSDDGESSSDTQSSAVTPSRDPKHMEPVPGALPSSPGGSGADGLAGLLTPTSTKQPTFARVLPTDRLLLPKGWKIDCTLETAIDTSLQGLVTCLTPVDIFGLDGTTVLLPRGSLLTGETRGEARHGLARVFVLWTEARTPPPDSVVAMLDSPGTDELGRSGLPGEVNRHFFERFGAALLTSVVEGAIQNATRPRGGDTVILNPSGASSVATEVLKSTVNIPPTILKNNGDRIQILVARDVDFRSVYELRPVANR